MYIRSILKELKQLIFEVDLTKPENEEKTIITKKIVRFDNDRLNGNYSIYHTKGLCITKSDFNIFKTSTDHFKVERDYIQISVLISGSSTILKKDIQKNISTGVVQLAYQKEDDIQFQMPKQNNKLLYVRILMSSDFYLRLLKDELWINDDLFYINVCNKKTVVFGNEPIILDLNIYQILLLITDNKYNTEHKIFYLKTKLKELLLTIHMNKISQVKPSFSEEISNKLKIAKAHLLAHYTNPPTIKELSKIIFLNEFKLKKGFKEYFGITIHNFTTDIRMEEAKKLILKRHMITEVAVMVGYRNPSHFIATFKKKYGQTPKQFLEIINPIFILIIGIT